MSEIFNEFKLNLMVIKYECHVLINLNALFDSFPLDRKYFNIKYMNKVKEVSGSSYFTSTKSFYNQLTIQCRFERVINVRVFNNGKIIIVNIRNKEESDEIYNHLISILRDVKIVQDTTINTPTILRQLKYEDLTPTTSDNVNKDIVKHYAELYTLYKWLHIEDPDLFNFFTYIPERKKIRNTDILKECVKIKSENIHLLHNIFNILKKYITVSGTVETIGSYTFNEFIENSLELGEIIKTIWANRNTVQSHILPIVYTKQTFDKLPPTVDICMINKGSELKNNYMFDLTTVNRLLQPLKSDRINVKYEAEEFTGLRIAVRCITDSATIILHNSGCINISGAKSMEDIEYAKEFITNFAEENFDEICHIKPKIDELEISKVNLFFYDKVCFIKKNYECRYTDNVRKLAMLQAF